MPSSAADFAEMRCGAAENPAVHKLGAATRTEAALKAAMGRLIEP
jgi:hypothetical protein